MHRLGLTDITAVVAARPSDIWTEQPSVSPTGFLLKTLFCWSAGRSARIFSAAIAAHSELSQRILDGGFEVGIITSKLRVASD